MAKVLAKSGGGEATSIRGRGPIHQVPRQAPRRAEEVNNLLQKRGRDILQCQKDGQLITSVHNVQQLGVTGPQMRVKFTQHKDVR